MFLSFFIFKKFIKSNRQSKFLNLISTISILGICLGVATLIIALSIVSGFEKRLNEKIMDMDSHIKIFTIEFDKYFNIKLTNSLLEKSQDLIEYTSPYLSGIVILSKRNNSDGLMLKGIMDKSFLKNLESNLINGKVDFTKRNNLIIGKSFANKLSLKVGDQIPLFSISKFSKYDFPKIELFKVVGVYESGLAKYDDFIAFTDLSSAQEFLIEKNDLINGIDIKLKNLDNVFDLTKDIRQKLKFPLYAQNIFEMHRSIFTWIELQKKPIPIVLSLIILVAVFNIISTLFLMVIERTSSIGILKSLGLKRKQILGIFLFQGIQIATTGIFFGNLLAILLIFIQSEFNIIKVPANIYMVTNVPFDLSIEIFLIVSTITLILALLASFIPSIVSTKINPIKAIKFQ
ncbi:MAG: ABC transporter permease [Ignavibacterium sp.]|nr:ABC transporter permease [Ignavibacterium sp.]